MWWIFGRKPSDNPAGSGQLSERELRLGYFGHVFADYCRLPRESRERLTGTGPDAPGDLPVSLGKLLRAVEQSGSIPKDLEPLVDWSEIAILEDKILALQDRETLRRRVWALRSRYARLVGPDRYQQYLASRPPDETDPNVTDDTLRADLRGVLGLTHLTYSLAVVRENLRRRVLMGVFGLAGVLCGGALVAAVVADLIRLRPMVQGSWWLALQHRLPVAVAILVVVLFGCLGAFLSTQRRLQQPSEGGDPLIAILGLYEFNNIKRFPLIAGGLFATVLYFILVAGFLKGDLFPELPAGIPQGSVAWAKLVIWAFLSGFAERLVPDTLDRLVNEVQPRVPVSPPSSGPADSGRSAGKPIPGDVKPPEQAEEQKPEEPEVPPGESDSQGTSGAEEETRGEQKQETPK